MSEREFEAYLNLLARTLKLSEDQRQHIAGELRDHLEERMQDLIDQGMDRDAAILAALDEFGDANVLAHDLSEPRKQLRRRKLMQTSFATLAAAALIATGFFYLMPVQSKNGVPMIGTSHAQRGVENSDQDTPAQLPLDHLISVNYAGDPLESVLSDLGERININLKVQWASLETINIHPDWPVTMKLDDVRAGLAIDLLMESLPNSTDRHPADYEMRENVLVVSRFDHSKNQTLVLETYDCIELLELCARFNNELQDLTNSGTKRVANPVGELADFIRETMGEMAWVNGESIAVLSGIMVVKQTPERHEQLKMLLTEIMGKLVLREGDDQATRELWSRVLPIQKNIDEAEQAITALGSNIDVLAAFDSTPQIEDRLANLRKMKILMNSELSTHLKLRRAIVSDQHYEQLSSWYRQDQTPKSMGAAPLKKP